MSLRGNAFAAGLALVLGAAASVPCPPQTPRDALRTLTSTIAHADHDDHPGHASDRSSAREARSVRETSMVAVCGCGCGRRAKGATTLSPLEPGLPGEAAQASAPSSESVLADGSPRGASGHPRPTDAVPRSG
jgi:hypothetical protein